MGDEFGRLMIIRLYPSHNHKRGVTALCQCGNIWKGYTYNLTRKDSPVQSCGCLKDEKSSARMKVMATKHGLKNTIEYRTWQNIKVRCLNNKRHNYRWYGGQGVKVCKRWLNSFENFLKDMGKRPSPEYTIDRIDPSGNYEPSNCRWVTWGIQRLNKRRND